MVQYPDSFSYTYSEAEASALRDSIIQGYVKPRFEACFDIYQKLRSAVLLVAQYWNDEAHDAVHYIFFVSMLETPDIKAIFESYNRETWKFKGKKIKIIEKDEDPVNLPGLPGHREILSVGENKFYQDKNYKIGWDQNGSAIPAFAAFCKEGSHQDMEIEKAYTPYAVLRRKGKDIEVEVIGKMFRPWLNGIKPEEWNE